VIIYPFRVKMAESPWREMSGDEALVTFRFLILPLFQVDAEQYVQMHAWCMYPLLPTMKGVGADLLKQAMDELAALYRNDQSTLAQHFVYMSLFLERTETISPAEKVEIQRRLSMYDRLWEESPRVKEMRREIRAEIRAESKLEDKWRRCAMRWS
jgi:hypothetical protein